MRQRAQRSTLACRRSTTALPSALFIAKMRLIASEATPFYERLLPCFLGRGGAPLLSRPPSGGRTERSLCGRVWIKLL
jgi:hypothetical protein